MKVYELISALEKFPAGADVELSEALCNSIFIRELDEKEIENGIVFDPKLVGNTVYF